MKKGFLVIALLLIIIGCTKQTQDLSQQTIDQEVEGPILNDTQIEEAPETDLPINEARGDYEVRRQVSMKITSSAFSNNERIPIKYTCDGSDTIPPLNFEDVPEDTRSLVLVIDDPDVPRDIMASGIYDHWVLFNIPASTESVEEGRSPEGTKGKTTGGSLFYEGPCPPGEEHRYFFKLYALDTMLDLSQGATKQQVENAMQGYVLAEATLIGLYG